MQILNIKYNQLKHDGLNIWQYKKWYSIMCNHNKYYVFSVLKVILSMNVYIKYT